MPLTLVLLAAALPLVLQSSYEQDEDLPFVADQEPPSDWMLDETLGSDSSDVLEYDSRRDPPEQALPKSKLRLQDRGSSRLGEDPAGPAAGPSRRGGGMLYVPDYLISLSQFGGPESRCTLDMSVPIFNMSPRIYYPSDQVSLKHLEPSWVGNTSTMGVCPWELLPLDFGEGRSPRMVLSARCLCEGHRCSQLGGAFRCTPLNMRLLLRTRKRGAFIVSYVPVSVACVCAQRLGRRSINVNPVLHD